MPVNKNPQQLFRQYQDARIVEIENSLLQGIFACRTTESVEAAVTYTKFLSSIGITPENYPVFLKCWRSKITGSSTR